MKGFGYYPREPCPACLSPLLTIPFNIAVVETEPGKKRISYEWVCFGCGRIFRDYCYPSFGNLTSKVERMTLIFDGPRPKTPESMARLKEHDLTMYTSFLEVFQEMETIIKERIESKRYSNQAMHFLYTMRFLFKLGERITGARIKSVNDWFGGKK